MTKTKVKQNSNFWERNRKSGGYLLKKRIMEVGVPAGPAGSVPPEFGPM